MHKIKILLLFLSLSLSCFSQLKTNNQNEINKDLYRLNLNDSVKSVVYDRTFYKEDLTAYEIDDITDIVILRQNSYESYEFNKYGLISRHFSDSLVYDPKDLQNNFKYELDKKVYRVPDWTGMANLNMQNVNKTTFKRSNCFKNLDSDFAYKYNFDKNGKITAEKEYFVNKDVSNNIIETQLYQTKKYVYDVKGNLIQQRLINEGEYKENNYYTEKDGAHEKWIYEYDVKNRLIKVTEMYAVEPQEVQEPPIVQKYKYHPTENYVTEVEIFYEDGFGSYGKYKKAKFYYNKNADIIACEYLNDNLPKQEKVFYEYEYDSHNNWIKCKLRRNSMQDEVIKTIKRKISYYGN
ncbi:hypothetical protein ASE21_15050 [Flavobacterium sp. Root901]|uniref:hypothetical protein n=1 Tax=Flavobacterium sp. Root901 TaxID=1736605 RepID=UPI000710B073|nr:hypothetical protein [Flavobacterium sp. Root901]KRD09159.1 hypothetical protein ASE21_15050 [Flavobacterium sp. Root901]